MCYLVTWFNPTKVNELNIIQTQTWGTESLARESAADKLNTGCSEVRVWKLVATPFIEQTISWKEQGEFPTLRDDGPTAA